MGEQAAAGCEGKVGYSSFNEARRAMRKREGKKMSAYRCRFCHRIHLGRTLGEGKRPRIEEPVE